MKYQMSINLNTSKEMLRKIQSIFILFLLIVIGTTAKAALSLGQFQVQSQYLSSGKIRYTSGTSTTFVADFYFAKAGDSYNRVLVSLVLIENGIETTLSTPIERTESEWGSSIIWQSQITGVLPSGKTSGNVFLKYQVFNFATPGGSFLSATSFGLIDAATIPSSGFIFEGYFSRTIDDGFKVYIYMDGVARHIVNHETLVGVFKKDTPLQNKTKQDMLNFTVRNPNGSLDNYHLQIGTPIGPNTRIVEDVNTGRIYYQEENVLRYITSPAVADKYHFNISNENRYRINGITGYTIGKQF